MIPTGPDTRPAAAPAGPSPAAAADAAPASAAEAPPTDVTVVIVSYETPEHLARCLDSLAADGVVGRLEIIVVDNSQGDACAEVARRDGVRLVRNRRNLGYARAVNQGIELAGTPFVVVLNPDIEVRPGSIGRLRRAMDERPEAGLAAARLHNPDGTLQYSCRRFYTFGTILLRRTFLGRLFPDHRLVREHLMMDWDHASVRDVDWVMGACLMVRRAALDEVGAMDERFFLYFEDVDWCARMHNRGWAVLYVPDAVMIHHHRRESARGGVLSPAARLHLTSVVRFYEKWSMLLYILRRNRPAIRRAVLLVADLAALNAAFLLAFGTRRVLAPWFERPLFAVTDYWQFLLVYNVVSLLALRGFGLYRGGRPADALGLIVKVTPSLLIASLAVLVSTFLLYIRAYSRFVVVLNLPLAIAAVTGLRLALRRLLTGLAERGIATRRVLMIGDRSLAEWMATRLRDLSSIHYEVVGIHSHEAPPVAPAAGAARRVLELCRAERVSELLIADRTGEVLPLAKALMPLEAEGLRVRLVGSFSRALGPGMTVEAMAGVPVLMPGGESGPAHSGFKRLVDIAVAAPLLAILAVPVVWVRLIASLGAGTITDAGAPGFTAAGERVWMPAYRASGSAQGAETLLAMARELWEVVRGRLSLVGIRRYAAPPAQPVPVCLAARPGLLTPAVGGPAPDAGRQQPAATAAAAPPAEMALAADQTYVLGWSLATDLRLVLDAIRLRRR